ncbi:MAG: hypothetical protein WA064_03510 [Candidatus Moraniibacteriota bacterium]
MLTKGTKKSFSEEAKRQLALVNKSIGNYGKPIRGRYLTLYHGTNSRNLEKILKEGIKPRGKHKSNWESGIGISRNDLVYLTYCYACYFASASCKKKGDVPVIIKLKIDTKNTELFPDEEFIFRALHKAGEGLDHKKAVMMYNKIDPRKYDGKKYWEASLKFMGTVCAEYIPVGSIVGYAEGNSSEFMKNCDPSISPINYKIMSASYIDYLESLDYKQV